MLNKAIGSIIDEMQHLLVELDDARYSSPSMALEGTSIGEHTRHVVEIFQCLINQYENGVINYDLRERNKAIETNTLKAITHLKEIQLTFDKPDKPLILVQEVGGSEANIATNYYRELLYNLEHCIHHQALIKLAVLKFPDIELSETFGLAPSTIQYKNKTGSMGNN